MWRYNSTVHRDLSREIFRFIKHFESRCAQCTSRPQDYHFIAGRKFGADSSKCLTRSIDSWHPVWQCGFSCLILWCASALSCIPKSSLTAALLGRLRLLGMTSHPVSRRKIPLNVDASVCIMFLNHTIGLSCDEITLAGKSAHGNLASVIVAAPFRCAEPPLGKP